MSGKQCDKAVIDALIKANMLSFDLDKVAAFSRELSATGCDAEGGMVICNHNYCIVARDPVIE
ncbi:hypothetical protein [Thermoactinomyces mirandus]|uniref:Uncharacterized protein n=1 Tax=Thermoactinomyces mirandus TaxID=2756294 RepID=A0A7W2AQJ0_9BACL|nr:hypothetical protein [Thermoactinomyces mirandus]MBA4601568.1 hypothetical protein [Thermoactinomyces mirandus]